MAAALQNAFGRKVELIEAEDGVFDVAVNGEVVYSKRDEGDFPSDPEIVELVRGHRSRPAV